MPALELKATGPYLAQILRGRGFFGEGTVGLESVFCRLASQAIDEYELARHYLIEYVRSEASPNSVPSPGNVATWPVSPLLIAGGKLENCIHVLHRCVRCLAALRRRHDAGVTIDKNLSVLRAASRIGGFRDDIEHVYNDLSKDAIASDKPHTIQVAAAEVRLRENRIRYSDLATWLRQLYDVASSINQDRTQS